MGLINQTFVRSFLVLASGTLLAQLIQIFTYPFLTRLFTPEDFGVKAFFSMVLILTAAVSSGKYEEAVTIPENDQDAVDLVMLSFFVTIIASILFAIFFFFFHENLFRHLSEYDFLIYVILVPLGIIGTNVVNTLTHWSLRKGEFKIQSKVKIIQSSVKSIFEVTGGFFKIGSIVLVIGVVLGMAGGTITFLTYFFSQIKKKGLEFRTSFSRERLKSISNRFIDFPKYFVFVDLLNKIINHLPIFFLTAYSSIEIIGHYSIAVLAVAIPNEIFMGSILKVFYSQIAQKLSSKQKDVKQLFIMSVVISTCLSLILSVLFFFLGKPVLLFVFGNQWAIAGDILKNYGWIILAMTWFNIALYILRLLEKQKEFMIFNIWKLLILSFGFFVSIQNEVDEIKSIFVFVFLLILTSGFQLFMGYRYLLNRG